MSIDNKHKEVVNSREEAEQIERDKIAKEVEAVGPEKRLAFVKYINELIAEDD